MTNIEDNTDKRFQQLSMVTGLTTQSARDEVFKETSAAQKIFLEKVETGIKEAEKIISESVSIQKVNIKESKEYIQTLFGNAAKLYDKLSTSTNEKLENFKNQGKVKGKEVLNLLTTNLPEGINSADELIEKFSNKVRTNMELEKKVEYALEQSTVLKLQLEKSESKISVLESKVEELNNIDFSGAYNGQPEESKTMTSQLLDKTKVVLDYIGRYLAAKEVLGYIAGTAVGTVGAGLGLAIGGIAVGVADLYDMDRKNTKNWENIVKENSSVDGQIARLQAVKEDLGREDPVIKPDLLDGIIPLAPLKEMMEKVLENKDNEELYKEGIADINYYVASHLNRLKNTKINQLREKYYDQENNDLEKLAFESMYNDPKQEIIPKLEDEINPIYKFLNEYKQAIEEMYKSLTVNNQSEVPGSLLPCIQKTKEEMKELEKASTFQTILDNYERAMEKAPKVWDLLGLDDEARIKQEISKIQNLLTSLVSNDGTVVDTIEFKENKEKLKALQEELEAVEAAAEMKREEENAMRNLVNVMNHFGNNLIAVGEGLNSSFLKNSGNVVNAFSSITDGFNLFKGNGGLSSITGMFKGGMTGSVKGLESITGALTSVSGIIAGVNVALSLVSSLSGKDKKKKIEKSNEENKQAFEN